ncbi:MAG: S24 family peptidase [Parabacteroides sp.]|nr:S24 family peptidase [Parabacteroides sp.]
MENILHRIEILTKNEGITITALERKIGASKGVLSRALNNNTDIQAKWVQSVVENYPLYSSEWLLLGKGPMLKTETERKIKVHRIHTPPYNEKNHEALVPLYNIDAAANLRTIFDNKQQNIIDTIRIPDLPKCDGAIYIRGDSMYPLLKSGDIVIYKEISDFDSLIFGEMYLIDFTINNDDFLVVKFVKRSNIAGHIQLVSYNIHHDPIDIPVQGCIRAMALIKASVRINTMM